VIPNTPNFYSTQRSRSARSAVTAGIIILLGVLTIATTPARAQGNAEAGAQKAGTCAACHGVDGNSVNPQWPSIAGQNESYIVKTLNAFKSGTRTDLLMSAQAAVLNDQDIADLAAHYAAQKPAQRTANPELAVAGELLYRGGSQTAQISACIACHGPTGRGNGPAAYPAVAGQHAVYTAKQLADYQSGARTSDGDAQIMRNITARLSKDEINAVAAYMQGLN